MKGKYASDETFGPRKLCVHAVPVIYYYFCVLVSYVALGVELSDLRMKKKKKKKQ